MLVNNVSRRHIAGIIAVAGALSPSAVFASQPSWDDAAPESLISSSSSAIESASLIAAMPVSDPSPVSVDPMFAPSSDPFADYFSLPSFSADGAFVPAVSPGLKALLTPLLPDAYADWRQVFSTARLGEFDVPLRSDDAERTNILLAAEAIDNVEVAPGEVFSFNDTVGERTPERGYQDGWMFDQGKLIRGTGGGICLIATGVYNAALRAGLEPVERHPHSGLVSYAPPGCDAAVVYGSEDLKFKNTTSSSILIRAIPEDDHVTVALFGSTPPSGYKVVVEPQVLQTLAPKVIEKPDASVPDGQVVVDQKARPGFVVRVNRLFSEDGHVIRHEVLATERRAARDKILRVPAQKTAPTDEQIEDYLMGLT